MAGLVLGKFSEGCLKAVLFQSHVFFLLILCVINMGEEAQIPSPTSDQ